MDDDDEACCDDTPAGGTDDDDGNCDDDDDKVGLNGSDTGPNLSRSDSERPPGFIGVARSSSNL